VVHQAALGVLVCGVAACSYAPPGATVDSGELGDAASDSASDATIDAAIDAPGIDGPALPVTTDHPSVADTHIGVAQPNTNFDGQTSMLADGGSNDCAALVRFDLTAIPAGATIEAAELRIWVANDAGQTCTVFPVLEAWDAATATWNARSSNTAWTTAGAKPPSRSTVAIGSVVASPTGSEKVLAVDPLLVAGWVAAPATNHGFAIVTTSSDGARFVTSEGTSERRPIMRVTYTP
jgi:hypothetical protein